MQQQHLEREHGYVPGSMVRDWHRKKTGELNEMTTSAMQKIRLEEKEKKERALAAVPTWEMPTVYMQAYTPQVKQALSQITDEMTPQRAEKLVEASAILNPHEDIAVQVEASQQLVDEPCVRLTDAHMSTADIIDKAVEMLEEMRTVPTIIILSNLRYMVLGNFLKHWKYSYQGMAIPIVCADGHAKDDVVVYGSKKTNEGWIL